MKPISEMPLAYAELASPLEWTKFIYMQRVEQPPRETNLLLAEMFERFGWAIPADWAAFVTNGEYTDAEMLDWDDMLPDDGSGFALQPRRSQALLVGANGPIYHPTTMVPYGDPIVHPGRAA